MTREELRAAIAAERGELADVLAGLPAARWDAETLCAGWRVREVVAHTTMPFRYPVRRIAWELLKARGDFAAMADRCARRDAASMSTGELVAALNDNAQHPWQPPGGGFAGALTHEVVHGLDYTVPLGLGRTVPADRLRVVLETLSAPRSIRHFGVDLCGVWLRADDLNWSFGSGATACGTAQDLVLVLAGRRLAPGRLRGPQSARFTDARRHT